MVKVTEVSGGGGPEVSSTETLFRGMTLGAVGPGAASGAGAGCRRPQPKAAPSPSTRVQVAAPGGLRDIAAISETSGEQRIQESKRWKVKVRGER